MIGEFNQTTKYAIILCCLLIVPLTKAQNLSLDANADLVSRYIWRGLNVNDQANIQPSITFGYTGLNLGFWGSYGLSQQNSSETSYTVSQEIDTWLSYTYEFGNGVNVSAILTDYYYPAGGIKIGNFNNYDDAKGPGAHTLEAGITYSGPETCPLSLSGYINIYNDKGNNMYFQADYDLEISDVALDIFIGASPGSGENPAYYGSDKFNVINTGIKVSKQIKITEDFSLPVFASYILNPHAEISYLVFGISL